IAAKTGILSTLVDSGAVQALRRGSAFLAFANNENEWLLSVFFLIPQIAALRLYKWKKAHGSEVRQAIETIANVEALVALGNYAAENPAHNYPSVQDTQDGELTFRAKGLGHPLIDGAVCVRNDVALAKESRYWVISGSNMGGKSTLLRAIGLNLSLAWAGAPVCAESLETSTGAIAASISVNDALGEGQSKFSAEVTLLKKILDYVESSPGCFVLLDELLSGTNTGDRRVAALEIVRRLANAQSLGIVTTHDLAVSADLLTLPGFQPKHFSATETAEGLQFDYKVRDGVVQGTNGLAVLRMLGIDVKMGSL
ncbi:MAG: mismatch repair protein, partial [Acidobacteria bacterium]|nr:mismatch repair protein [Acidobacteriota bacterium]